MDEFVISEVMADIKRTREAVRYIKQLEVSTLDRKYTLSAWFREHTRAAPTREQKLNAYNALLGPAENARLRG